MKTAQQSAEKYASRAAAASSDYVNGAASTSKDQAAAAIAAKEIYKQAVTQAAADGRYERGLQKSGKGKWLRGVQTVGAGRFAEGVAGASGDYAQESARFDGARSAASSLPRQIKGSPANLQRVAAVVNAQIAAKKGK